MAVMMTFNSAFSGLSRSPLRRRHNASFAAITQILLRCIIKSLIRSPSPTAATRITCGLKRAKQDWETSMQEPLPHGGLIRKVWIAEAERYRDHLLRLDDASRRSRFGGATSEETVRRHAALAFSAGHVVHGFFVDGILRGAAELITFAGARAREAEAAFSIEQRWQSHGVGSALLERTLLAARNRGIRFLHLECLADNARMQQLARKFDAELSFDFCGVVGEVTTPGPTPLSLMREALVEGHGFATAVLDVQSRMLKSG
jgi:GNAT superfamily N-acetyltransferase